MRNMPTKQEPNMDKIELLEEMIRYQDEQSSSEEPNLKFMLRGRYLFNELEKRAETQELRTLSRSYRRHLDQEIDTFRKSQLG